MTIARCWAVSYGWRGPAARGGRCPRSTASSPPPTGDGGRGRSGVCGSASFRRWDGKRYPDRRPNPASDAVGTVFGTAQNRREGFFSETGLPTNGFLGNQFPTLRVLGNLTLSCVAMRVLRG